MLHYEYVHFIYVQEYRGSRVITAVKRPELKRYLAVVLIRLGCVVNRQYKGVLAAFYMDYGIPKFFYESCDVALPRHIAPNQGEVFQAVYVPAIGGNPGPQGMSTTARYRFNS